MTAQRAIDVLAVALMQFLIAELPTLGRERDPGATEQRPAAAVWTLSPSPLTSIGGGSDPNATVTRVVSVVRLRDDRVLLWEPRPASVRLFDAQGRFIRLFAREGSGPGEVRDARWIGVAADTVFIFDGTQRRLTRFHPTGDLVSTVPFGVSVGAETYTVTGRWQKGAFVLRSADAGFSGRGADGVRRDSIWVALADSAGGALRRVVRLPGATVFAKALSGGGVYVSALPFSASGLVAVGNDMFWIGDNSSSTLLGYDQLGQLKRRVTVPFESVPVERSVTVARRDRELETARTSAVRSLISEKYAVVPKTTPCYSGLAVAPDGDLWVTAFVGDDSVAPEVAIISPDGRVRATLRLPPRFRVVQVDANAVLGIYRDEDDAEFVQIYGIRR